MTRHHSRLLREPEWRAGTPFPLPETDRPAGPSYRGGSQDITAKCSGAKNSLVGVLLLRETHGRLIVVSPVPRCVCWSPRASLASYEAISGAIKEHNPDVLLGCVL